MYLPCVAGAPSRRAPLQLVIRSAREKGPVGADLVKNISKFNCFVYFYRNLERGWHLISAGISITVPD